MVNIRAAQPEYDFERIAALISATQPEPVSAETIHGWEARQPEGMIRRRSVAIDRDGSVIGYSIIQYERWMPAGRFYCWLTIDPDYRRQGIGEQLYEHTLTLARQYGAAELQSEVRDNFADGLRFAEQRGFSIRRHTFESTLDLAAFDPARFAEQVARVEASGMPIFSLADAGNTEEAMRKLHAVNYRAVMDDPGTSGSFPSFPDFREMLLTSKWFLPEGQFMAAEGDEVIGLSAVGYFAENNSMYNMITGVDRDYRGRGIAQALKIRAITFAQQYGAAYIRTNNDSNNAPMLAINRRLGYQPETGIYRLYQSLTDTPHIDKG